MSEVVIEYCDVFTESQISSIGRFIRFAINHRTVPFIAVIKKECCVDFVPLSFDHKEFVAFVFANPYYTANRGRIKEK